MKMTTSLKERLFVMFLDRDMELARLIGSPKAMKHHISVAGNDLILAMDAFAAERKCGSGGGS